MTSGQQKTLLRAKNRDSSTHHTSGAGQGQEQVAMPEPGCQDTAGLSRGRCVHAVKMQV